MASTFKWGAVESIASALTTELNSLANAAFSALSAAIDNSAGLYQFMAIELVLASLTPSGSPYMNVYLIKQVDGTNDEDSSTTTNWPAIIATIPLSTSASAKRRIVASIPIPPCSFKLQVENKSGVTLAASGNTLKYMRTYTQAV